MLKNLKEKKYNSYHVIFIGILPLIVSVVLIYYAVPTIMKHEAESVDGWYFVNSQTIGIQIDNLTAYRIRHVINHEVGHHIWHTCLNSSQINDWKSLNISDECIFYNDTNEDFAESYASYLMGYEYSYDCFAKHRYFSNLSKERLKC